MARQLSERERRRRRKEREAQELNTASSASGSLVPSKDEIIPTQGALKDTAASRKKITIIVVVVVVAIALAVVLFMALAGAGAKGAVDTIIRESGNAPTPQSYILPAFRHLVEAGSFFYKIVLY